MISSWKHVKFSKWHKQNCCSSLDCLETVTFTLSPAAVSHSEHCRKGARQNPKDRSHELGRDWQPDGEGSGWPTRQEGLQRVWEMELRYLFDANKMLLK